MGEIRGNKVDGETATATHQLAIRDVLCLFSLCFSVVKNNGSDEINK